MAAVLHGSARTTPRVRSELQAAKESTRALAARFGLNPKTVAKWRGRQSTGDAAMGPCDPRSTVLTPAEEAMIVEFRRRTLLPLDDVTGSLRDAIPKLTRSALHLPKNRGRYPEIAAMFGGHIFDRVCKEHHIEHRLTKPYHPWTNGQAERMNRTIKDATSKAFHYPSLDALRDHVLRFVSAYNFAKHLKAIRWQTPFQSICDAWHRDPSAFKVNPHHLIAGPNT